MGRSPPRLPVICELFKERCFDVGGLSIYSAFLVLFQPLSPFEVAVWKLTVKVGFSGSEDVADLTADSTTEVADSTSSTMSPLALPRTTALLYRAEERS